MVDEPEGSDIRIIPPMQWSVHEEGNVVIIEFTCRDNYEAIELAEVMGAGMTAGSITMEFEQNV